MKTLLCLAAALAVCGCQQEQKEPAPMPASIKEPPKAQETPTDTSFKDDIQKEQNQEGFNKKRVYQLKDLDTRTLTVGGKKIKLWIMDTNSKREEGLMWVEEKDIKDNEGMLFVFSKPSKQSFWMQNTVSALDLAFIDSKGKVLNVGQGKPFDEKNIDSKGEAQYVLEMKLGKCQKFGILAGTVLQLPKDVPAKD